MYVEVPKTAADALAAKHLPWTSTAEIEDQLKHLNWHPDNAKELSPIIAENYNGAFRKGMEVALRSVFFENGKLVVKLPDSSVVELKESFPRSDTETAAIKRFFEIKVTGCGNCPSQTCDSATVSYYCGESGTETEKHRRYAENFSELTPSCPMWPKTKLQSNSSIA